MIINIIGMEIVSNVNNATGQVRTGCIIHFTYDDYRVAGIAVGTKYISSQCFPFEEIHIDETYYLQESEKHSTQLQTLDDYFGLISQDGGNDQWQDCE